MGESSINYWGVITLFKIFMCLAALDFSYDTWNRHCIMGDLSSQRTDSLVMMCVLSSCGILA